MSRCSLKGEVFYGSGGIIRDSAIWLECLDQPIAQQCGSESRLFNMAPQNVKDVWPCCGAYIHYRRLSAVALRLTPHRFWTSRAQPLNSQQTFTARIQRSSLQTHHFTAVLLNGVVLPLRLGGHYADTIYHPGRSPLIGYCQSFCSLEQISDFRHEMRYQFWHDFLENARRPFRRLSGLDETRRVRIKNDGQK